MGKNDVLWLLSGDTTIMFELLADEPELVKMAQKVANKKAKYQDLKELVNNYF